MIDEPWPGFSRQWVICWCGRVAQYFYQPYSLSTPIYTMPCGHRFEDVKRISETDALNLLAATDG